MRDVAETQNHDFKLSKKALERIKFLLKDEANKFFKISVLGGGCSGFQYEFSFVESPTKNDLIFRTFYQIK